MSQIRFARVTVFFALCILFLCLDSSVKAQNEGIGTFNDLVGEALETTATPTPTPEAMTMSPTGRALVQTAAAAPTAPATTWKAGIEYDYRFKQQKTGNQFAADTEEVHSSVSVSRDPFRLTGEYFHIWTDGSADDGSHSHSDADGVKMTASQALVTSTQPNRFGFIPEAVFLFPVSYSSEVNDVFMPSGRVVADTNTYVLSPVLALAGSWNLGGGESKDRKLKLSFSSGYRLMFSNKDFKLGNSSNGYVGSVNFLQRADYDFSTNLSANAAIGWTHRANYHSSNSAPPPTRDSASIAGGVIYRPTLVGKDHLEARLTYQFDGFNPDSYGHSVTLIVNYKF